MNSRRAKTEQAMTRSVPTELATRVNRQVLGHVEGLSAHSDVADALTIALKPLGDVQPFCPNPQQYRYVVASTRGVIFALALGMDTTGFRLDERMKTRQAEARLSQNAGMSGYPLRSSVMIGRRSIWSSGLGKPTWPPGNPKDHNAQHHLPLDGLRQALGEEHHPALVALRCFRC